MGEPIDRRWATAGWALCIATACWRSHGLPIADAGMDAPAPSIDASHRDPPDAPPSLDARAAADAPVRDAPIALDAPDDAPVSVDAGECTPVYDVDRVCTLRRARALTASPDVAGSDVLALDSSDRVYLQLAISRGSSLAVDAIRIDSTDEAATVSFEADTLHARFALGREHAGLAARGDRVLALSYPGSIDLIDASTGGVLRSTSISGLGSMGVALAPCASCSERELVAFLWNDHVTIGGASIDTSPTGISIAMLSEGRFAWYQRLASVTGHDVVLPRHFGGPDSIAIAVRNVWAPGTRCLEPPLPCLERDHSVLLILSAAGAVQHTVPIDATVQAIEMGTDSSVYVSTTTSITRYTPTGEPTWSQPLGRYAGPIALDEPRERIWVAVGIPDEGIRIGDAVVRPCPDPSTIGFVHGSVLVEIALGTGEVQSVVALSRSTYAPQLEARRDGALVAALNWAMESIDVCGETILPEAPAARVDVALVIVE